MALSISILTFKIPHKIGVWCVARLKVSISLEILSLEGDFSIFGPLGEVKNAKGKIF